MRRVLACLIVLAIAPTASARDAWKLVDIEGDTLPAKAERIGIKDDLRARLAVMFSIVPEQTPRQREKVETRLAKIDDEDLGSSSRGRFFLSLDYQHYQLRELLDDADSRLKCISTALKEDAIAMEMSCWAQLATVYLAEERLALGLSTLRRRNVIPRDDDMPRVAQDPRVWYAEFGRGIVRGIVTPYLKQASGVE